ncbi:hypothetical protein ACIQVU_18640 [Lysinibacillus sp. NPDC098008]|uniref:hypothetical protein n=1 Tax=Lysinibacillus sp. NPDC098008 TaxID=3364146 RepID=UPI00380EA213
MRLRELKENIESIWKEDAKIGKKEINSNLYEVSNITLINEKLSNLEKYGIFKTDLDELSQKVPTLYNYRGGAMRVNPNELAKYEKVISNINLKVDAVLKAIEVAIPPQEPNSISIKLPPYQGLKKVSRFIGDIEKILSQILPPDLNTEVKLNNFDTGSNWIEVIVNNKESLVFIGSFVEITVLFAKKYVVSLLKTKSSLDSSSKVEQEKRDEVNKVLDTLLKEYASIEVEKLVSDMNLTDERVGNLIEYKERVSKQLIELAKYMSEGAEIHPALNAPKEVKKEFPEVPEIKSLSNEAKTLLLNDVMDNGEEELNEED